MRRVVRTPRAKADLIELCTYIATDSRTVADRMLDLIDQKLDGLAANPRIGAARPDIAREIRLFPVKRYVILYRELTEGIEVVRVVQGMRRMSSIIEKM